VIPAIRHDVRSSSEAARILRRMAEFANTLKDVLTLYRDSLTMPVPSAVDTSRDVISTGKGGHGTHKQRGRIASFRGDKPFSERFAEWLAMAVAYWRYEMDVERRGVERAEVPEALVELARGLHGIASTRGTGAADKAGPAKRAEDKAILALKGDPIVVGLLFGRTSEAVRKLRERNEQDPHTGDRARKPSPLTSRVPGG
jgi:hypothetical protein